MTGRHRGRPTFPTPAAPAGRHRTPGSGSFPIVACASAVLLAVLAGPILGQAAAPSAIADTVHTAPLPVLPLPPAAPRTPTSRTR
jgi:hypothetical protein